MISDTQVRMAWGQTPGLSKSPDKAADLEQCRFEFHVSIYMDYMNYGKLYANFSNIKKMCVEYLVQDEVENLSLPRHTGGVDS